MKPLKDMAISLMTILPGILIIFLILSISITPKIGLALRYDFSTILLIVFFLIVLGFQLPTGFVRIVILGLTCLILAIPVNGLWSSGQSEQYVLGGIIPFSDANFYYMDARRLQENFQFVTGAARRPIFAAILTSIQWITNQNLYVTIGILVFIVALTLYLATCEIRSGEGVFAGGLFFILVFFFVRFLLGKLLSEMAGLPLGLLSFVFLYRSAKFQKKWFFLIGLFFLSLALNARAGAFFVLPVIAIWGCFVFCTSKKKAVQVLFEAIIAIILGFGLNLLLYQMVSSPNNLPFGNFSMTLYGLTQGGRGWTLIYEDHPEVLSMHNLEMYDYVYQLSYQSIITNPMLFIKGITSSYITFFSLDNYYGSLCWFGSDGTIGNVARLFLYVLMLIGIGFSSRNHKNPVRTLLLAAFLGIFLSIPFAPPLDSNRMRVYAATIPFFIAIPALGFSDLLKKLNIKFADKQAFTQSSMKEPLITGLVLIGLTFLAPVLFILNKQKITLPINNCPPGETSLVFRMLPGNNIHIVEQGSINQDWLPLIQKKNFATLLHDLPNWELFPVFSKVEPGQVILADLDLRAMDDMVLIADYDSLDHSTKIQSVCARSLSDSNPDVKRFNVFISTD